MSDHMNLREEVVTDINRLWKQAQENRIIMQGFSNSQEGRIEFKDLFRGVQVLPKKNPPPMAQTYIS